MVDDLDSLFDEGLPKGKKAIKFLKRAYDCGAQGLQGEHLGPEAPEAVRLR